MLFTCERPPGRRPTLDKSQEVLLRKWFHQELSNCEMAKRLSVDEATIRRTLKRLKLTRKDGSGHRRFGVACRRRGRNAGNHDAGWGGFSPKLFARLIAQRCDIITYRKGKSGKLPKHCLTTEREKIDGREREYELCDRPRVRVGALPARP